ncbi:hypothetical protein GY45DRAFT_1390266 [Cubamyces sp. BRFM 1775]|nr:hypothetical protein GY45DRAFT_1390266 [Cubamyces sp. BRFM 1775]
MRALYYQFRWDTFRLDALAHILPEHQDQLADWPDDHVWTVKAAAVARATTSSRGEGEHPRKRRSIEREVEDGSESSENASENDFEVPLNDAALRHRNKTALAVRPPPPAAGMQDVIDEGIAQELGNDPWLRAMHVLHVAASPGALPCQEAEYGRVLHAVEELLEEGRGGCNYISGVSGMGKMATVHAVVRELTRVAEQDEANPLAYIEINGLKREGDVAARRASGLPEDMPVWSSWTSELDQLMTAKQDVVYNFFNWPMLAGCKLVVLAMANTMDLPARMVRIVRTRLASAKLGLPADMPRVIAPDALKFAAMKKRMARTEDVKAVIKDMQNSPRAAYLGELSFHERLMLAALIKCVRKEGVEEIRWSEVQHQHLVYLILLSGGNAEDDRDPAAACHGRPSTDKLTIYIVDGDGESIYSGWNEEHVIMTLRHYYALRDEAHETVAESRRIWVDTPFSVSAAMLEHSQKNYGALPSELRPHRVRSRTSSSASPYPLRNQRSALSLDKPRSSPIQVFTDAPSTPFAAPAPEQPVLFDVQRDANVY